MDKVINDFNIEVATVNGSGSQTANNVLLRAIFQMGIPVSGKNLFPSNIAGLPTWFTIRVSKDGYVARKATSDIVVVMNPETAEDDAAKIGPGGVIVLNDQIAIPELPEDHIVYRVPMKALIEPITKDVKLRRLVVNMIYVGVLARLIDISEAEIERALDSQLGAKPKAVALNHQAVRAGWEYADEHLPKRDKFHLAPMNATQGKVLIDGNAAAALGAMFGGVTVVTWYPITPSSSLIEALSGYLEKYRKEESGKRTFAVIQSEDEIGAIGMVLGAGWAGARAMTATSGPGISLMTELTGYGYYAEIPAVIWDIQRAGPSTGLPTRTAQSDISLVYNLSHGDSHHPILLPSSVEDCFEFGMKAFDLAERLQTPVFVLSDLDLAMNNWMSTPFKYPDAPLDRGKVLDDEALDKMEHFERYRDVDGDGIPYRTLPGGKNPKGAFFTRGSGHDEKAHYTESPETYARVLDRLKAKFDTARTLMPPPVVEDDPKAKVGVIAFGSGHWAAIEARDHMMERGLHTGYLLLKALPFNSEMRAFLERYDRIYVVEQNRDGQMADLVRLEAPDLAGKVHSVCHYLGLPINARFVWNGIFGQEGIVTEGADPGEGVPAAVGPADAHRGVTIEEEAL